MLILPDYEIVAIIYQDTVTCVYRGRIRDTQVPVILKTIQPTALTPKHLARLRHEYAILADLDFRGVARPLALLEHQHALILVQEDIGGGPLTSLISMGACPLDMFFPIALALVGILDYIHRRQIIHRDIKPSNIIVNLATGRVQLIDFELASRLSREQPQLTPPDKIEGTLAYLAPEQTGRMNRAIDYRADFYSLGVTFYELLTSRKPFVADDALEWIHSHIARPPRPPIELVPDLPVPLAELVLKLLAKLAEDRYQSAAGLAHDLQRCAGEWLATGHIAPFAIGSTDRSDRFQLPQRLYGRETEVAELLGAFGRVAATGQPELVLVAGYSGIGKSALVAELHKPVVAQRGYFIAGKFDQYRRGIPYATIAQALQSLIQQLLAESAVHVDQWRNCILGAVGDHGQLVIDLIPQVQLIIGPQPAVPELPPDQAQHRLNRLFQRFIAVFTQPEHPLVLFLDDLQWVDSATLRLLTILCTNADTRYLLMIGAYRNNEVTSAHPLMVMLDELRKQDQRIEAITLAALTEAHVGEILAATLHCSVGHAAPLAALVYSKTRGNPFFTFQFLYALYYDGLVTFDLQRSEWHWDMPAIRARNFTDNVVELMLGELQRMPSATQQALTLAGFLGNRFEIAMLAMVSEEPPAIIATQLWPAIQVGLVMRHDGECRFLHDRVQEAAYLLTPEADRVAVHARIGRLLRQHVPEADQDERLFDIVTHLNAGAALISDPTERWDAAELNRRAGAKARAATIHTAAAGYFAAGIALLPPDMWNQYYDLSLALHLGQAECEYLQGQFAAAEWLLDIVIHRARNPIDRAHAHMIRISLLVTRGDPPGACAVAQIGLTDLGLELPERPTDDDIQAGYQEIQTLLAGHPAEYLLELPEATDPAMAMATRMVIFTSTAAFFSNQKLWAYHDTQMIVQCLRYGHVDSSPLGCVFYGFILANYLHHYQEGYRYCEVAQELMEQRGLTQHRGSLLYHKGVVALWVRPVQECIEMMRQAIPALLESGNIVIAGISARTIVTMRMQHGEVLEAVEEEADRCEAFVALLNYPAVRTLNRATRRLVRRLRGVWDETEEGNTAPADGNDRIPFVIVGELLSEITWHCVMNEYAAAHEKMLLARPLLWGTIGLLPNHDFFFYGSISLAVRHDSAPPEEQAELRDWLHENLEQLRLWAAGNPKTFEAGHLLVAAEIERVEGRPFNALRLIDQSMEFARANGLPQHEAIACECAARLYFAHGVTGSAMRWLHEARQFYASWGANSKVRQLEKQYPQLRQPDAEPSSISTSSTNMTQLDTLAIIKAAQAISGQIVHDQLLQSLLQVVLEHAGAQFGALLLAEGDDLGLAATATVTQQQITVQLYRGDGSVIALPISILAYVRRSHERVLLDDARLPHPFAADPYLVARQPCAVLTLPILRQGTLVGVLYLEHQSITHVFTSTRLAVLDQLAAQAAISLENAQLYATLEQQVAARTADLKTALIDVQGANTRLEGLLNFARFLQHEVRGYAAGLEGLTPILRQGFETHPQAAYYLQRMGGLEDTVAQMNDLTQRMLILTREGTLPIQQHQAVALRPMLEQVRGKALDFAKHLDLPLEITLVDGPEVSVPGDALYLSLACFTGLRNAVEVLATQDRNAPQITIMITPENGQVLVRVCDNGPGFPDTLLEGIAQARQRGSGLVIGWSSKSGGSGLGLALMDRVAQLHGGHLTVGNRDDGPGAWVALTLPM